MDLSVNMNHEITVSRSLFRSFWLFALSLFFIVAQTMMTGETSILFTYSAALVLGIALLKGTRILHFFLAAFFINTIFAVLLSLYFQLENGTPFSVGADDHAFYDISKKISNGDKAVLPSLNYKAYVLTFAFYFDILRFLGFSSQFYFHLNILNCFFGAFAAPLIYLIAKGVSTEKTATSVAWMTLLYPPFIYYSATIIRDIVIAVLAFSVIYTACFLKWKALYRLIFLIVLIFVLYHVRPASAFFASFFVIYFLLSRKSLIPQLLLKGSVISVFIFLVLMHIVSINISPPESQPPVSHFLEYLSYTSHYYQDLMIAQADKESLGVVVRTSEHPLVIGFSLLYMYLSPIPPLFLKNFDLPYVFLGIGNVLWYYFAILFLIVLIFREKDPLKRHFQWSVLFTSLLAIIVINFSSGDPRHFYFLQPLILLAGLDYLKRDANFFLSYTRAFFMTLFLLALLFVTFKLLV